MLQNFLVEVALQPPLQNLVALILFKGRRKKYLKAFQAGSMLDAGTFSVDGGGGGGLDLKSLMAILGGLGLVGGDKKTKRIPCDGSSSVYGYFSSS